MLNNPFEKENCGNCQHWMIMNYCPREYYVEGGHRGPHMSSYCEKFQWSELAFQSALNGEKVNGQRNNNA